MASPSFPASSPRPPPKDGDMRLFGFEINRIRPKETRPPRFPRGARARLSRDDPTAGRFANFFESRPENLTTWIISNYDEQTLSCFDPDELITMMSDISPEISRAVWDFLRFCNPGWEAVALSGDEQSEAGQAALDAMVARLDDYYGAADTQINRLFFAGLLRGAMLAEMVLDEAGREFVDLATPDPLYIRFRKIQDEERGDIWQMGQWVDGTFTPLEVETIRYIPIDPLPGKPYGRSVIGPAIFSALFLISLLHDLKRVVQQQGYPRIDLSIDTERLMAIMPEDISTGSEEFGAWVQDTINEIANVYEQLEPEDAYVHLDTISINRPVGTLDASSLGQIDSLVRTLERMIVRAVKSIPLLFGSNESTTETHANRQWEIHVAGIKSIQHYAESMLSRLFTLALQAQGIPATVEWRFAELRASEMLRDAQTEMILIQNEKAKYEQGWISQDEGSEAITGSPADVEEPRTSSGGLPDFLRGDGDGEERRRYLAAIRDARQTIAEVFSANGD